MCEEFKRVMGFWEGRSQGDRHYKRQAMGFSWVIGRDREGLGKGFIFTTKSLFCWEAEEDDGFVFDMGC